MNKGRLRKLAQRLDKTRPERFEMSRWCGSACCIAGHALLMARQGHRRNDEHFGPVRERAANYLGLDHAEGLKLMDPDLDFYAATPKQAAKVIRHLVKTGKVEWEKFV